MLILLHASLNASTVYLLGPAMSRHGIRPFLFVIAATWVTAFIVIAVAGFDLSRMGVEAIQLRSSGESGFGGQAKASEHHKRL